MILGHGQEAPPTAAPRPCPEFSAQFGYYHHQLSPAPVTGWPGPQSRANTSAIWGYRTRVSWGLSPLLWLILAFGLPQVSGPAEVHIASLITSLEPLAHFYTGYLPYLPPSVPCRMRFLSFPWALVSLPGVGQDIGFLGHLNADGLWFHPGKRGACMGHQRPRTLVSDRCPPLGGADLDHATDHLLQPWIGAQYQPQP